MEPVESEARGKTVPFEKGFLSSSVKATLVRVCFEGVLNSVPFHVQKLCTNFLTFMEYSGSLRKVSTSAPMEVHWKVWQVAQPS